MIKKPHRSGHYYSNELWFSEAYRSLPIAARNLLQCLISELRWTRRGKIKIYTNNGQLSFTEVEFKKLELGCSATYLKARNKLIEVGLIKQKKRGGMCRGDMAEYKLLFTDDCLSTEMRWKRYPEENWAHEIPKRKKQLVGVKTQWKKGQSGRKTKPTLIK
tara:strand:- start:50 stop:532 length:483 start_codon:yes stop_codon:yes gene_type:complete